MVKFDLFLLYLDYIILFSFCMFLRRSNSYSFSFSFNAIYTCPLFIHLCLPFLVTFKFLKSSNPHYYWLYLFIFLPFDISPFCTPLSPLYITYRSDLVHRCRNPCIPFLIPLYTLNVHL